MSRNWIHVSNGTSLASIGAHAFCCGLPAISALISLVSGVGTVGAGAAHELAHTIENLHPLLIGFSTLMLAIALISALVAERRDCVTEGHCGHPPCGSKKRTSGRVLAVSIALYAVNLLIFFLVG